MSLPANRPASEPPHRAASAGEVTRLLSQLHAQDTEAGSRLMDLVYLELRRMAGVRMAGEAPDHTLQPTALVHEAWLRMVGDGSTSFANRAHFFAVASEAMRRILIESARRRLAMKRGGGCGHESLQEVHAPHLGPTEELLAVHEVLDQLKAEDPLAARLVDLRYFVGMDIEEASSVLGLSRRTTERAWTYARAWLKRRLTSSGFGGNPSPPTPLPQ